MLQLKGVKTPRNKFEFKILSFMMTYKHVLSNSLQPNEQAPFQFPNMPGNFNRRGCPPSASKGFWSPSF